MTNHLWRIFVPTWRFFDRPGLRPKLFVRSSRDEPWRRVAWPIVRNWRSIVFAPENAWAHANHNLLDRLLTEIADDVDLERSVTWRLTRRLAAAAIASAAVDPGRGAASFDLRLTAGDETVLTAEGLRP